jgi:hypothetical protein
VAIFYRNDGQEIPDPGIMVIRKIDSGVEAFNVPSSVRSDAPPPVQKTHQGVGYKLRC